ncbi:MAG: hypothetical protein H0V47_03055 [Chloroflexia bacterium]|nr:hypothetical protein [Chloroflexia bacterium]
MTGNQPVDQGGEGEAVRKNETTKERVDRLVAEGEMTAQAVANAERVWKERLANGILMPTGDMATVTLSDLHHVIVDIRILRKFERIERMLKGIFEVRTSRLDRRLALTRWHEEHPLVGLVVLLDSNQLWTLHVVDDKRLRREQNKGTLLWRRLEHP